MSGASVKGCSLVDDGCSKGGRAKLRSKLVSIAISTLPAESFWKRANPTEGTESDSLCEWNG